MTTGRFALCAIVAALIGLAGCATSFMTEEQRQEMEADIDEILSYELDESEVGGPRRCLSKNEYRNFRALGDRHLLFEGRNDKQWVNVLRGRCNALRHNSIFIMKKSSSGRACDFDQFDVADRSDPMVLQGIARGTSCTLGEFVPVVKLQVHEIERRLETR